MKSIKDCQDILGKMLTQASWNTLVDALGDATNPDNAVAFLKKPIAKAYLKKQ